MLFQDVFNRSLVIFGQDDIIQASCSFADHKERETTFRIGRNAIPAPH